MGGRDPRSRPFPKHSHRRFSALLDCDLPPPPRPTAAPTQPPCGPPGVCRRVSSEGEWERGREEGTDGRTERKIERLRMRERERERERETGWEATVRKYKERENLPFASMQYAVVIIVAASFASRVLIHRCPLLLPASRPFT